MDRRDFLKYCSLLGVSVFIGKTSAYANWLTNEKRNGFPRGMLLIDAHSHPDQFYYMGPRDGDQWEIWCTQNCDDSSTLEKITKLGMHGSSFAAIGDTQSRSLTMDEVKSQIQKVINLEEEGFVKIVRCQKDMPHGSPLKNYIPGAVLTLEGASPLGEDNEVVFANLDILYGYGVRMITLMHYLDNQFGHSMWKGQVNPNDDGLSELGRNCVERMMELGIMVDVAHAHYQTLSDIVKVALAKRKPLIDSHTSLSPSENIGGRLRTWGEMELITSTGGIVCTWPLKWVRDDGLGRLKIDDWAKENSELKERLGSEHIALGTDGGGILPDMVDGYNSILDLPKLVKAMYEVGFKRREIDAYMGGNFLRVIKQSIG